MRSKTIIQYLFAILTPISMMGVVQRGEDPWMQAVHLGAGIAFDEQGIDPEDQNVEFYTQPVPEMDGKGGIPVVLQPFSDRYANKGWLGMTKNQFAAGVANYTRNLPMSGRGLIYINDGSSDAKMMQKNIQSRLLNFKPIDVNFADPRIANRIAAAGTNIAVVCWSPQTLAKRSGDLIDLAKGAPDVTFVLPFSAGKVGPPYPYNVAVVVPLPDTNYATQPNWLKVSAKANGAGLDPILAFQGYAGAKAALDLRTPGEFPPPARSRSVHW